MTLGPIVFGAPWALLGLLALPALYWIIRAAPPPPRRALFPPLRLLAGLATDEETRRRAPLWLVVLRAVIAALVILGFARPSLAPTAEAAAIDGPMLLVLDDGWTSAARWGEIRAAAAAAASEAERAGESVYLLRTAPQRRPEALQAAPAAEVRGRLARLDPQAWRPDRADALKRLEAARARYGRIVWVSDGLDDSGARAFGEALVRRGPVIVRAPEGAPRALGTVEATESGFSVEVVRGDGASPEGAVAAETRDGRSLGSATFRFPAGGLRTEAAIPLPPEIAARAARVRIVGEESAGAVRLIAAGSGRPLVGLIDVGAGAGQPLLSDLFYVDRAIAPFATARRGEASALIAQGAQALILPDASALAPGERAEVERWLERGGLLVRFAGPRLANDSDDLVPVRLRPGARSLGGALAWERPQPVAPFPQDSPFAGLAVPPDVAVRQQVLAEPSAERDARVWARLADGAPVVTAAARGQGLIVLFHVTAGPDWSNLPLSGLYVDLLRATLEFAGRAEGAAQSRNAAEPWSAERLIDGYGAWAAPPPDLAPVPDAAIADARPGPTSPPGLYARQGGAAAAIQALAPGESFAPLPTPGGAVREGVDGARDLNLAGPLLALAAALLALDLLISLALAGRLPRLPRRTAATAAALLTVLLVVAPETASARIRADDPTLEVRLAYVRTGDARLDRQTAAGLAALSQALRDRTAVEPGEPVALDPARDDLTPYPLIYWAAPDDPRRLSDPAIANLNRYMRLGGLLFIDTRDAGRGPSDQEPGPAAILLQGFDVPPLAPVGDGHVLTKGFYLLRSFPGTYRNARLWAETESAAAARDGVAALIVGDGAWAAAWAQYDGYAAQAAFMDVRPRSEMPIRFGVNLVMMALTGNYKTDQVHVPALLQRLGRESAPQRAPR